MQAAFGFLISVAYWPGLLSPAYVPRWAAIAIGLPLVSRLDPRRLDPLALTAAIIFLALAWTSLRWTPGTGGALECFYLTLLFGALLLGAGLNEAGLDRLLTGMLVGLAPSSLLSILTATTGWLPVLQFSQQPGGLFGSSEILGEFAAPLFIWALLRRSPQALIPAVPIALTQSRIVWVTTALVSLAMWPRLGRMTRCAAVAVVLASGCGLLILLGAPKADSAGTRIVIWVATAMAFRPGGQGIGWFTSAHPAEEFAHSDVLQAFVELGLGAAIVAIVPAVALFRAGDRSLAARSALLALCLESVVSFPLHTPASGFLAAVLAGHLARRRDHVRDPEPVGGMAHGDGLRWSAPADRAA